MKQQAYNSATKSPPQRAFCLLDPLILPNINGTVACASSHQQDAAFADSKRFSVGFSGVGTTTRHSSRLR